MISEEDKKKLKEFNKKYREKISDRFDERVYRNLEANKDRELC